MIVVTDKEFPEDTKCTVLALGKSGIISQLTLTLKQAQEFARLIHHPPTAWTDIRDASYFVEGIDTILSCYGDSFYTRINPR